MIVVPTFCPACAARLERRRLGPHRHVHLACPSCAFVHFDNPVPCAGVLVVEDGRLLLGKRRQNPFRGWWNVLGGFVEGNEHPEETAVREVWEEAGLRVHLEGLVGIFMDRYGRTPERTMNLVYMGRVVGGEATPGDDIVALRWFRPEEVPLARVAFDCGRRGVQAWLRTVGAAE